jgi:uncharacterized protein (DUF433 family)
MAISIGSHRGQTGGIVPRVSSIESYFAAGMTVEEILKRNPTLKREDVESALDLAGWAKTFDFNEVKRYRSTMIGL